MDIDDTAHPEGSSPLPQAAALELREVTKRYRGQPDPAIVDLSLSVGAGEVCVLVGPSASGLFYNALDSGQVNVSDVFTTDPQLGSGKYVVLTDPKHEFGFQNVALVIKKSVLQAEGPAFAQTINAVNALLTTKAIIAMNAAVALNKQSPATVAHSFLAANKLL